MDTLTTSIILILSKYALDKGVELAKEVGPAASEIAGRLFAAVVDRLRQEPRGQTVSEEFERDPETYERPLQKQLQAAVSADADFAAQLRELVSRYEQAAAAHASSTGISASLQGGGAIAQGPGATAVGSRGVSIGGSNTGTIITGDHVHYVGGSPTALPATTQSASYQPDAVLPSATLREKLIGAFNDSELRDLCVDLGIDYDSLGGEGKAGKVRELISYCERHGRLPDLLAYVRDKRPRVEW
jgi:hypothetical protein